MSHALDPCATPTPARAILKRVGIVLLAVGLVDIGVMLWCIANDRAYASSFNLFAVVAGVLLMRGSLRTAVLVRWFALLLLAGFAALMLAWPWIQPLDLSLTQLRLYPARSIAAVLVWACAMALLYWVARRLGSAPVERGLAVAGRRLHDARLPAVLGAGLVALLAGLMALLLGGETAEHARAMAQSQLGPGYRYHVVGFDTWSHGQGQSIVGRVVAWNEREIRQVAVRWDEQ